MLWCAMCAAREDGMDEALVSEDMNTLQTAWQTIVDIQYFGGVEKLCDRILILKT